MIEPVVYSVLLVRAGRPGEVVTARRGDDPPVSSTVDSSGYARLRVGPGLVDVQAGGSSASVVMPAGDASLERLTGGCDDPLGDDDRSYLRFWRSSPAAKVRAHLDDPDGDGRWMATSAMPGATPVELTASLYDLSRAPAGDVATFTPRFPSYAGVGVAGLGVTDDGIMVPDPVMVAADPAGRVVAMLVPTSQTRAGDDGTGIGYRMSLPGGGERRVDFDMPDAAATLTGIIGQSIPIPPDASGRVPDGGDAGDVLEKLSDADGDYGWGAAGSGDDAWPWAEEGNTAAIPANKLGSGQNRDHFQIIVNDHEDIGDPATGWQRLGTALQGGLGSRAASTQVGIIIDNRSNVGTAGIQWLSLVELMRHLSTDTQRYVISDAQSELVAGPHGTEGQVLSFDASRHPAVIDGPVDALTVALNDQDLTITLGRTSGADLARTVTIPGGVTDYDDLTDKPIFRVPGPSDIPAPSAATLGRRYQANNGREYIIVRRTVAGTDRVVEFEEYSTAAGGFQGAVNDVPATAPTAADVGKWWLIRGAVDSGTAPFVLVDANLNYASIGHVPDAGHTFVHPHGRDFYEGGSAQARADHNVNAASAVIYAGTPGQPDWNLYRVVAATFDPGTPVHDEYEIANADAPIDLVRTMERYAFGEFLWSGDMGIVANERWERVGDFAVPDEARILMMRFGKQGSTNAYRPEGHWYELDLALMRSERDAAPGTQPADNGAVDYTTQGFVSVSSRASTASGTFPDRDSFLALDDDEHLFLTGRTGRSAANRTYYDLEVRWK